MFHPQDRAEGGQTGDIYREPCLVYIYSDSLPGARTKQKKAVLESLYLLFNNSHHFSTSPPTLLSTPSIRPVCRVKRRIQCQESPPAHEESSCFRRSPPSIELSHPTAEHDSHS